MDVPILSIIVVSYNTKELLKRCLDAIEVASIALPYEVIVVDNASTDGSAEMVDAEYPEVHLLRSPTNLGFSKANNAGIRIAQGESVLLLNSDAFIGSGLVETLWHHLKSDAASAAIGPRVLNEDGSLQSKGFLFPSIWYECLALLRLQMLLGGRLLERCFPRFFWTEMHTQPVDWVSGCCIMIRKNALIALGGLDERFFLYWEDVEWCYRARKQHYKIWYCGEVSVVHSDRASPSPKREEIGLASRNLFFRVTGMRIRGCIVMFIGVLSNIISIAAATVRGDRARIKKHCSNIRGASQFIWSLSRPNPKQTE